MAYNKNTGIPQFEDLKRWLMENRGGHPAAGGKEVVIRCPWCGDSRNHRDAHLYVGPKKGLGIIKYNCFLCPASGTVNSEFFRMINCRDIGLINEVYEYQRSKMKDPDFNYQDYVGPTRNQLWISNQDAVNPLEKLAYINSRLGSTFQFDHLARLKICVNLNRFLQDNGVGERTRSARIVQQFSDACIGFLSMDNNYMTMRTLGDESKLDRDIARRYNYYLINSNAWNPVTFYTVPGTVDLQKPITFHISEGVFDTLGIWHHVVPKEQRPNAIFSAACGKTNYMYLMRYFFTVLMIPPSLSSIHLYIDKEPDGSIDLDQYSYFLNRMAELQVPMTIHVNNYPGEKDFGVARELTLDTVIYHQDYTERTF